MGTSGCGKTTTLDVVTNYRQEGYFRGCRRLVGGSGSIQEKLQFVTSGLQLLPMMTVREVLTHYLCYLDRTAGERAELFWRSLQELDLDEVVDTAVGNCSDGQVRRLGIALGLISEPAILVLDEPTSGLDSETALKVALLLRKIARTGRCVVASVHQPSNEVFFCCENLLLMSSGDIVAFGSPQQCCHLLDIEFASLDVGNCLLEAMARRAGDPAFVVQQQRDNLLHTQLFLADMLDRRLVSRDISMSFVNQTPAAMPSATKRTGWLNQLSNLAYYKTATGLGAFGHTSFLQGFCRGPLLIMVVVNLFIPVAFFQYQPDNAEQLQVGCQRKILSHSLLRRQMVLFFVGLCV